MKKLLTIVLVFLIAILSIIMVREVILNNEGKLDKTSRMTREEVILLLEKGETYKNYYYSPETYENDEMKTEYYIKDNYKQQCKNAT